MANPDSIDQQAEAAASQAPEINKRRKRLLIAGAVLLLLVVAAVGIFVMKEMGDGDGAGAGGWAAGADYVDIPEMVVNLRSPDGASRFLKIHLMLVPGAKATADGLRSRIPPLLDAYQPFLRELRPEDLAGSAAVFRIKEELLRRSNAAVGEGMVKDILIQDLVQQ